MKLVTVAEMLAIEKEAAANGLSYDDMMNSAGQGLANIILNLPYGGQGEDPHIVALVGPGNNGGDALVALAELAAQGWRSCAYLVKRKAFGDTLVEKLQQAGGEILFTEKDKDFSILSDLLRTATILLDGLLGTGTQLPVRDPIADVLYLAQGVLAELDRPPFIVAVDCPSGIDCDTGEVDACTLAADLTVTMAAVKHGLLMLPAFEHVGELQPVAIGDLSSLPAWQKISSEVADHEFVHTHLPERALDAHKGTFGTALVLAGSVNYPGAALLAGEAACRSGAGLVNMGVPASIHLALVGALPEAIWTPLPHENGHISDKALDVLTNSLSQAQALLIGPGLGGQAATIKFIEGLISGRAVGKKYASKIGFLHANQETDGQKTHALPPLIVDADGLNALAAIENWADLLPKDSVLTPHPGEMARLTGLEKDEIQKNRKALALQFSKAWEQVVVLKGAFTIIAEPSGRSMTIPVATPALARAGTGDVLAGLIAGFRAQGLDAFTAAVLGAWVHAQAGLYAADGLGNTAAVLAGDVLAAVIDVLADIS